MTQCQHIMATGRRCGTPAVKTHRFCYHHRRMHDTYCLPGDAAYEPEPLDSRQAITVQLHHLELALNKGRIDVHTYRARLLAVRLAITNLKHAATDPVTPTEPIVTQYTPAMRDLHHLNPNQPCEPVTHLCEKCSVEIPAESDTKPEPEEIIELEPLELPCPKEWLQPIGFPLPEGEPRLWYNLSFEEHRTYRFTPFNVLGTLEQENQRRRLQIDSRLHWNYHPTVFQIKDVIARIEEEERKHDPVAAANRQLLFKQHYGDLVSASPDQGIASPMPPAADEEARSGAEVRRSPSSVVPAQLTAREVV